MSDPDCTFADAGICVNPDHPTFPRQVILTGTEIQVGPPVGVLVEPAPHTGTLLLPSVPNPMHPSTKLRFALGTAGSAELTIVDVQGRERWQHFWPHLAAGLHEIPWTGVDQAGNPLASGVYFSRLATARGVVGREKLTIAR